METQNQSTNTTQSTERTIGSYKGAYAEVQSDLFEKLQTMFGVSETVADTIAYRLAADIGKLNAGSKMEVKLGKVNKKGLGSIKEALTTKKAFFTMPLKIARAVQWACEANENFVSHGFTAWKLNPECQEYVDNLS